MLRTVHRLTARAVRTISKVGLHADGAGLYLASARVRPARGSKSIARGRSAPSLGSVAFAM
jgi:hypothetical protein